MNICLIVGKFWQDTYYEESIMKFVISNDPAPSYDGAGSAKLSGY